MSNLLESIFDYQALVQRTTQLGLPLSETERLRLRATEQLLRCAGLLHPTRSLTDVRDWPVVPDALRVQFSTPLGFDSGDLRVITGDGCVVTEGRDGAGQRRGKDLAVGSQLLLRIIDHGLETTYFFPCKLVAHSDRFGLIAAFDGIPTRSMLRASEPPLSMTAIRLTPHAKAAHRAA